MARERLHISIGVGRAQALRHRANELGVTPTRLAASMVDAALDRLMDDPAFMVRWERGVREHEDRLKLAKWEGRA